METNDKIAFGALTVSLISILVATTTFFTRNSFNFESLSNAVGDPSVPSGLYGQVDIAKRDALEAKTLAQNAKSISDETRKSNQNASQVSSKASSDSALAIERVEKANILAKSAIDDSKKSLEFATEAFGKSDSALLQSVPIGSILAWIPTPKHPNPPKGWSICDGKNGTPNLEDRFLMGVKYVDKAQAVGGRKDIPSDGNHNHGGKTGVAPESGAPKKNGHDGHHTHAHDHPISNGGGHNHGGNNTPPYYTVVYIMKTN